MTKRKSKTAANFKPEREDNSFLIESHPVSESRGRVNQLALPCMLFLMVAIGGASAGWFCLQQQQSIDQLSETFRAMEIRITKFQQQMGMREAQVRDWSDCEIVTWSWVGYIVGLCNNVNQMSPAENDKGFGVVIKALRRKDRKVLLVSIPPVTEYTLN